MAFDCHDDPGVEIQVVQSLAKWKRFALGKYGYAPGSGLYTDMNAIRRDEETDNLHSIYVDQWDWEKVITRTERNEPTSSATAARIQRRRAGGGNGAAQPLPPPCTPPPAGRI